MPPAPSRRPRSRTALSAASAVAVDDARAESVVKLVLCGDDETVAVPAAEPVTRAVIDADALSVVCAVGTAHEEALARNDDDTPDDADAGAVRRGDAEFVSDG